MRHSLPGQIGLPCTRNAVHARPTARRERYLPPGRCAVRTLPIGPRGIPPHGACSERSPSRLAGRRVKLFPPGVSLVFAAVVAATLGGAILSSQLLEVRHADAASVASSWRTVAAAERVVSAL